MNIPVELNKFSLPKTVTYDAEYENDLHNYLDEYYEYILTKIPDYEVHVNKIKDNIDLIKNCIHQYYNGKLNEAYCCIKKILEAYIDSPYIVASIDENYAFRGMAPKKIRASIYSGEEHDKIYKPMLEHELYFFRARINPEKIDIKDMLHIPFNKRGMVATQRFSIAGLPCIYLSRTSFGTWLELGLPEPDVFQVSAFKIPTNLKMLNLCIHQDTINGASNFINNEKEKEGFLSYLEIFPLVIATSYHIQEMNRKFKSEYIISQIVMQVCNELGIDGVAYLSKRIKDFDAYPQAVNLAIAIPYNRGFSYWSRANEVWITEPVTFLDFCEMNITNEGVENFRSYVNEIYKKNYSNQITLGGNEVKYTDTKHSAFDEYLLGKEFFRYTDIKGIQGK